MKRVQDADAAVVATGCVTPLAFGTAAVRAALAAGRAVRPPAGRVEPPHLRTSLSPELESQAKFLNASGMMAATAAGEASLAADLARSGFAEGRKALYLAQYDMDHIDAHHFRTSFSEATDGFTKPVAAEALNQATVRKMNPFYLLETLTNNAFSLLTAFLSARGPNTSVSGWETQGLLAVSLGAREVARGDADVAFAVGAGAVASPAAQFEEDHVRALPPGAVASEGAGVVVVESVASAKRRGKRPLAAVKGLGASFDPAAAPRRGSVAALAAAAGQALSEAGIAPGELSSVAAADPEVVAAALRGLASARGAKVLPWHRALGEAGPASDVLDVALVAEALGDGSLPGPAALVLATGQEGYAMALVLARV